MTNREQANQKDENPFPIHWGTLQRTDPELVDISNYFATDQVLREHDTDTHTRWMVILAACIGSQSLLEYRLMVDASLQAGVTHIEVKEIVYQAVPYLGMARTLEFLLATNEIFENQGITLPLERQATTDHETRFKKGLQVQKSIFGETIDQMYSTSPANQLHIQKLLSANCFGDFVSRGGIDIQLRELLTFSFLLSLGGCESQLKGHIQGNLNVGNEKEKLLSVVTQLIPYIGYPRAINAIRCLNEIIPEN